MKILILANAFLLTVLFAALLLSGKEPQIWLVAVAITAAIIISGALTSYLWFKRGKIYEERGESGPDG